MKKLSILMALVMLCSVFAFSAFAADDATASISSVTATAGSTVTMTVTLKNNPGIVGAHLYVGYDANVMSYVSAKSLDSRFKLESSAQNENPVKLVMANMSLTEVSGEIKVAELTFQIAKNVSAGNYTVSLSVLEAYDKDVSDVPFKAENATVTVGTPTHTHAFTATVVPSENTEIGYTTYSCSCGHTYNGNFTYEAVKFVKQRTYTDAFTDVTKDKWFYPYVKTAYEYGLANGTSATKFSPDSKFTVAAALTAAANIHTIYYGKSVRAAAAGEAWYIPYAEYCINNGIISNGQFANYEKNITRGEMAIVFANILPDSEYTAVKSGAPIDVASGMACAAAVQKLYQAGIVGGDQGTGTYRPNDEIVRSEACVIFTRIAASENRIK